MFLTAAAERLACCCRVRLARCCLSCFLSVATDGCMLGVRVVIDKEQQANWPRGN